MADGTVYVGGGGGLHAVDAATGDRKWVFTNPADSVEAPPTVVNETVYFASREIDDGFLGALYAVDTGTGAQEWTFTLPARIQSAPTIVENPENGHSIDSRVRLGTLGHHHEWAGTDPPDPGESQDDSSPGRGDDASDTGGDDPGDADDGFGPGFGIGGALAGLGGAGYLLKRRLNDEDNEV